VEGGRRRVFRRGFWRSLAPTRDLHARPLPVRHGRADLQRSVKADPPLEFTATGLTPYAGPEVLRSDLGATRFNPRLRRQPGGLGLTGDFRSAPLVRLQLALVIVDGRYFRHVELLQGDPMSARLPGLTCLPAARSLSRWLRRFRGRRGGGVGARTCTELARGRRRRRVAQVKTGTTTIFVAATERWSRTPGGGLGSGVPQRGSLLTPGRYRRSGPVG